MIISTDPKVLGSNVGGLIPPTRSFAVVFDEDETGVIPLDPPFFEAYNQDASVAVLPHAQAVKVFDALCASLMADQDEMEGFEESALAALWDLDDGRSVIMGADVGVNDFASFGLETILRDMGVVNANLLFAPHFDPDLLRQQGELGSVWLDIFKSLEVPNLAGSAVLEQSETPDALPEATPHPSM